MPDFEARRKELTRSFQGLMGDLQPIEITRCEPALKELLDQRAALLTGLSVVLADEGWDPLADEYAEKLQRVFDAYVLPFDRMVDGLSDVTPELDMWREMAVAQETRFFTTLKALELGKARDAIDQLHLALADMIRVLDAKWATMSEESQRLEALEQEACRKMTEIVQQGISQGTEAWTRYGDALNKVLATFMELPDLVNDAVVYLAKEAGFPEELAKTIPKLSSVGKDTFEKAKELGIKASVVSQGLPMLMRDPGMAVSETIQKAIGPEFEVLVSALGYLYKYALPMASGEYGLQVEAYQRLLPNQGSILVSLSQTRQDVDTFLKTNGVDRLQQLFDTVMSDLDHWADGVGTDGQKADAGAWAKDVKEAFKRRYEGMRHEFEEFVRANKGRFIGTVEKDTEDKLLWSTLWVDREQGLASLGMDEKLKDWRAGTIEVTRTLDTASSQVFEKLRYLPNDMVDQITRALNDYWAKVRDQVRQGAEQASTTMATAQAKVSDDQVHRDLDRRALLDKVHAA